MLRPPAYPSTPPPPPEDGRPLGYFEAILWTLGITLALFWMAFLAAAIASGDSLLHPVTTSFCEVIAYLFGLFLMLRVHAPNERIRDFVAMRSTHPAFYLLAIAAGAGVAIPANWLLSKTLERFPMDAAATTPMEIYGAAGGGERALIIVATVLLVPLVEEVIFRGGIFGALVSNSKTTRPILATSLLFTVLHIEWRIFLPVFAIALVFGQLRAASRSLVPSLLMHAAINAFPFVALWQNWGDETPLWLVGAGSGVTLLAVVGIHALGNHLRDRPPRSLPPSSRAR